MKKFFVIAAALLAVAVSANAQVGIIAGLTTSETKIKNIDTKSAAQFHAGITYKIGLPLGFAIQPSLMYNARTAKAIGEVSSVADFTGSITTSYLELPIMVQYGFDLAVARAFVFAEPYVGYALGQKAKVEASTTVGDVAKAIIAGQDYKWDGINRFEYGVGLGLGAEVLQHIQVTLRYYWDMGSLFTEDSKINTDFNTIVENMKENKAGGIKLSVAYLF